MFQRNISAPSSVSVSKLSKELAEREIISWFLA
jgi:hypothetical protein